MNELEKRANHHRKFQKGCLFPFSNAETASLIESAEKLVGGESDEGKIVRFKKTSKKYQPGKFEIEKAFVKVYKGFTDVKYTLLCHPHDPMGTRYHLVELDDIEIVSDDGSNKSLSEARKSTRLLSEAVEKGVKVYDVEKDGPPEVGRQIIAFVDSHEEYTILTRQDKEYVNKQNWDDKEGHKSSDGEYYAGKNGWIYALGYSKYIYLDELDLIPQKHFDKVAREIEAGNQRKAELEDKLVKVYGKELVAKIAPEVISVRKDGRRVELPHYYSYLLAMPKHRDALRGLESALLRHIDKDTVKQVMAKTPGVVHNYPGSEQYKLSEGMEKIITERWSDDALEELSKKPKEEWTEDDWDTYNYCKNANAERDYYDSLDESKKKKVKGVHLNKDAGNVEYNIAAFNHAMNAAESPSTNPCGPMGESVGTKWVNFYYNGKKIGGYTAAEEFDGERADTLSLLAYDNNCDPDDIEVRIENDASNVVKEDFAKTKDYEYYKVTVPSPNRKGYCSFGIHEHHDGHCSISGIHPYDDGDYHWATSGDGVTFKLYVGNPGKLVKTIQSEGPGHENICKELAELDSNVKSVIVHW